MGEITAPKIDLLINNGPSQEAIEAASAKAYAGAQGIKWFFAVIQPKKKAGQPPKMMKKNGVITANTSAKNATRDSPPMVNVLTTLKKTRIKWGKGEHRDLLAKAIQDWLNKEGDTINKNGEEILGVHLFANKLGIPPQTFYKYICMENRRILGDRSRGKKKWILFSCGTSQVERLQ